MTSSRWGRIKAENIIKEIKVQSISEDGIVLSYGPKTFPAHFRITSRGLLLVADTATLKQALPQSLPIAEGDITIGYKLYEKFGWRYGPAEKIARLAQIQFSDGSEISLSKYLEQISNRRNDPHLPHEVVTINLDRIPAFRGMKIEGYIRDSSNNIVLCVDSATNERLKNAT